MEIIFASIGFCLVGILIGWVLNTLLRRYSIVPLRVSQSGKAYLTLGKHEHEYTHNPGDGYFYCNIEGCDARKKLGK